MVESRSIVRLAICGKVLCDVVRCCVRCAAPGAAAACVCVCARVYVCLRDVVWRGVVCGVWWGV